MKTAIKYFEYSLAGIPAVYSATLPYSQVVDNGATGLIAKDLTEAWVNAIRLFIDNAALCRHIAKGARHNVEQQLLEAGRYESNRRVLKTIAPRLAPAARAKGHAGKMKMAVRGILCMR
jgi:hypothetical protein